MKCNREERFLPVTSIYNARDIGGYPTKEGYCTKKHRFIRTAMLDKVTANDVQALKDYGITIDIDLRDQTELAKEKDLLMDDSYFTYINIDLCEKLNLFNITSDDNITDISDLYIWIIDEAKEKVYELFRIFIDHLDTGIIFHCSVGKDRTGTTAALLLDLVGVSRDDIITDFSESYENNIPKYLDEESGWSSFMRRMMASDRESMERFLDYLYDNYQDSYHYLLSIGFTKEELMALKNSFIQK